jgi:cytochrome P450
VWYDAFAKALANFTGDSAVRDAGRAAASEFGELVRGLLARHAAVPEPCLLSALVHAADRLTDDEIVSNALIILFGGIETTESMICNTVWALLCHPDQLAAVRRDRALLLPAIEEALRWEPAVQSCTRHATCETVLRGVAIAEGEVVQCLLGAANRDPMHFAEPDRFDIRRPNAGDHVSFGAGRHFCLGAPLARLETEIVLEELLWRFPRLALDPSRPSAPQGYEFRKPPELWVVFGAARGRGPGRGAEPC